LARAYNHLAEELEQSEERKAEALRQLAVTLNHSLNNAMSIIEMQLGLLDREVSGNPAQAEHLHQIRSSLLRMAETVASLRSIRRVVLTDYSEGERMVDLEASVALELPVASQQEGRSP
jgi:signal transduction histidine kinase